jgi:hypothetical protein
VEKTCSKCSEVKQITLFYKNGNLLRPDCKECTKQKTKKYYESNKEKCLQYASKYRRANNEKIKSYFKVNRRYLSIQKKINYQTNPNFKLQIILRSRVYSVLKRGAKVGSAVNDLGCSVEELRIHLETQFQPGMTWDNHGRDGWHIDHIRPLSAFDLSDPEQFKEACHYTNLQPLWAKDNLSKGCKFNFQFNENNVSTLQ